ncbi:MAG: hypothetical protein PUP93_28990, partial [Rhizonema sp. NSF051]|nr:hypothetical protein [Rhizonema sp. NSF051]
MSSTKNGSNKDNFITYTNRLREELLFEAFGLCVATKDTPVPPEDYRLGSRGAEEQRSRGEELTSVILQREGSSLFWKENSLDQISEGIFSLDFSKSYITKQGVDFIEQNMGINLRRGDLQGEGSSLQRIESPLSQTLSRFTLLPDLVMLSRLSTILSQELELTDKDLK